MSEITSNSLPLKPKAKLTLGADSDAKATLGFWIYLMTDCVLFATLFATYAVQHTAIFGGPSGQQLFNLPFVLLETMALLTSSFSAGLGLLAARRGSRSDVLFWFGITAILGVLFLSLELSEFHKLILDGNSFRRSGFLSSYFTLVGTHGLHIISGLVWMGVLLGKTAKKGLTTQTVRAWSLLSLFWHFLDIVWIFIFTIVYLFGSLGV
jgi:cytochrome o ubiquinol oxidase subunit 3